MEPKAIAKRSGQYFFVRVFVTTLHVIGNFIIAKLFTVAGYGAFGFLTLILTYGASLHLGLENAFGKQYPVEIGKGKKSHADNLRDSAFTFSMFMTFIVLISIVLFALIFPHAEFEKRWAYIIIALTLPLQMLVEYYRTFFRVTKEFGRINIMELIFGVFEFFLRVAPVYYFILVYRNVAYALIGLFIGLMLSFGISFLYAWIFAPERIRVRWSMPEVKYLFRLGIPIFICFLMDSLFKNGDKFMAKAFFQDEGMGYYLLGSQIAGLIYFVPFAIGFVIFPLMLQRYGETSDGTKVASYVFPPTSVIIQIILPLSVIMYLSLDFLIPAVLAKYIPTIPTAKILTAGIFFWCIVNMFTYFLIAMDDRLRMLIYQTSSLLLNLFLNWFFGVLLGMYIFGIGLGTVIAYFIYSLIILHYTISKYFGSVRDYALYYMKIISIFILVFLPVVLIDKFYLSQFWGEFFRSSAIFWFLRFIPSIKHIHTMFLLNGTGIYLLEIIIALIITGAISLAINRKKILSFNVDSSKTWSKPLL